MAEHAWCRSPARDEAVRADEDGRSGPLPTLAEAISRAGQFAPPEPPQEQKCTERDSVTERRPPEPGGGGNVTPDFAEQAKCSPAVSETGETQSGMRTERITLEITHDANDTAKEWPWKNILAGDDVWGFWPEKGESVRVVDTSAQAVADSVAWEGARDAYRGRIARVTAERDAAIRERDTLKARVDELESAAKLTLAANADAPSNHAAPAASGAAGTEPDAWGVRRKGGVDAVAHRLFRSSAERSAEQSGGTVVPLYAAPPPAKGWLTEEERLAISGAILILDQHGPTNIGRSLEALAAGVTCKEVGRE